MVGDGKLEVVGVSVSGNNDINALRGRSGTAGASAGEGVSVGGSVSINEGARPSYTGSVGIGGGATPVETHGFITNTEVQDRSSKCKKK